MAALTSLHSFRYVLYGIVLLNLLDATSTLFWVLQGSASEANPLMDAALGNGPMAFIATKFALVSLGVWLLWLRRDVLMARVAVIPAATLYALIGGHHVGYAFARLMGLYPHAPSVV